MDELVREVKRKLRERSAGYLRVHKGRGTAIGWLEIHREDYSEFLEHERKAIHDIFGHSAGGNFFCIRRTQGEMILGLRDKKPICSICGSIHPTEENARFCERTH